MIYKRTIGDWIFDTLNYIFMVFLMLITLYPFWNIFVSSISSPAAISAKGAMLVWPEGTNLDSYVLVFKNPMILTGYRNTLFLVVVGTSINMLMTVFGAYALSRKWLMGRKYMMLLITITMFFGGGLIPSYLLVRKLGLYDTLWAVILPGAVSSWNIIMMRTYFLGIPDSLEESALIDGANDFQILFKITIPVSVPIMAVMVLFYAVGHWNAWFGASIYIRNQDLFPLQLVLRRILLTGAKLHEFDLGYLGGADRQMIFKGLKYATVVVATVPILMVYPFIQKYFVKGIMIGSLKG
ncbi:MAG TPA: carbohydrate ABC transporter permease [Clostridiales bacterium]|nr:carbohydrate ABC transporter permease [Clostridiales bacterium]